MAGKGGGDRSIHRSLGADKTASMSHSTRAELENEAGAPDH